MGCDFTWNPLPPCHTKQGFWLTSEILFEWPLGYIQNLEETLKKLFCYYAIFTRFSMKIPFIYALKIQYSSKFWTFVVWEPVTVITKHSDWTQWKNSSLIVTLVGLKRKNTMTKKLQGYSSKFVILPTKKFEFIQNLHVLERIRAILENILESSKIVFQIS